MQVASETNPWPRFLRSDSLPPAALASGRFDLIYAYSVFTHLPEDVHRAWLPELRRLLRPGGVLVATVRPRSYIEQCAQIRGGASSGGPGWTPPGAQAFQDTAKFLAAYDRGEFCYSGREDSPHFGDACVPHAWVRNVWPKWLAVREFIADPTGCGQDVIVTAKA